MMDYKKRAEEDIKDWFKNHQAKYSAFIDGEDEIERLVWRRPDTINYMVTYVRLGNTLVVTGDLYDAIYRWSNLEDMKWIAGCNFDCFAGKCIASPTGRGYFEWDSDEAKRTLKEAAKDYEVPWDKIEANYPQLCSQNEWIPWLAVYGDECFEDMDWRMDSRITMPGEIISIHCQSHLIGLKMAFEQLGDKP